MPRDGDSHLDRECFHSRRKAAGCAVTLARAALAKIQRGDPDTGQVRWLVPLAARQAEEKVTSTFAALAFRLAVARR